MEENKRLYTIVLVIGLLSVLLSTCLGALAGGLVGYWTGQNVAKRVAEEHVEELQERQQPIIPEEPEQLLPLEPNGALVTDVVEDSPADKAGIRAGDLILAVDDVRIDRDNTLARTIRKYQPGDRVKVTLWSRGRERTMRVRLGEHPEEEDVAYLGVYHVLPMGMQEDSR
jgi:membrane-associated protease RseP (regulator of RpoE activity)